MKRVQHTRIFSILLAVCMLVSILPVDPVAGALDADMYNGGNAYYRYNMRIILSWYRSGFGHRRAERQRAALARPSALTYDAVYAAKMSSDPWTITENDIGDGTQYSGSMFNDGVKNKT